MGKLRWTDEDQAMAEKMRAFGSSYAEIGAALGFSQNMVSLRLNPERYENGKEKYRRWHQNNPEKSKACRTAFKAANPTYDREYTREWRRRKKQAPFWIHWVAGHGYSVRPDKSKPTEAVEVSMTDDGRIVAWTSVMAPDIETAREMLVQKLRDAGCNVTEDGDAADGET